MKTRTLLLALGLLASMTLSTPGRADVAPGTPADAVATRLEGLSQAEAQGLIDKLQGAQSDLRQRDGLTFDLLSGAPASYRQARLSPRDAFLGVSFAHPYLVRKLSPDKTGRQAYLVELLPNGFGRIVCDVEVVLGFDAQIQRVQLYYGPPAPF